MSSQNNNTLSSIGRNGETLAPLQQWFWHLCYFSDLSKKLISENLTLRIFSTFFFNLSSDVILVKEQGCMYVWMDGVNSDNALSIQTMVTRTMVTQKMVGQKMFSRNMVTPNMVCRNLVTLNMVTPKLLGTRLHRTGVQHR